MSLMYESKLKVGASLLANAVDQSLAICQC